MTYDLQRLRTAAATYARALRGTRRLYLHLHLDDRKGWFSLAPLSMAADKLGIDMHVHVSQRDDPYAASYLRLWDCHRDTTGKGREEMRAFLATLPRGFTSVFARPDVVLSSSRDGLRGTLDLPAAADWTAEPLRKELQRTARIVWRDVYALRRRETVGISFELVRHRPELPLTDYLDSLHISRAMLDAAHPRRIIGSASTSRASQRDDAESVSEMKAILLGCSQSDHSDEAPFAAFRRLARAIRLPRYRPSSAVFGIRGEGYGGRHRFGEAIGYPAPGGKTRWASPAMMAYKLDWHPQTALDPRPPRSRIAFTETIPARAFIDTCAIDWDSMTAKNRRIMAIGEKAKTIRVVGRRVGRWKTDLTVGLVSTSGKRRGWRGSDVAVRERIRSDKKKDGILAGTMANLPGGEGFVTPEWMEGVFVGDCVISLDRSHRLSARRPIVIECLGESYRILAGPKMILSLLEKKKREGVRTLAAQEKAGTIPKAVARLKRKNLNRVGEFAINTNPKAELSQYLIINEKIAGMIHIALGSGFDADRATVYHTDIVIDAPRQKLDIFGIDRHGTEHWIHRRGKLLV